LNPDLAVAVRKIAEEAKEDKGRPERRDRTGRTG